MNFCQFFHCLFYWNISLTDIHYSAFVSFFHFNLKAWIRTISYTFSNNVFTNTVIVLYHESQVTYSQWPMSFCFLYYSITYYSVLLYYFSVLFYCIIRYRGIFFENVIWAMTSSWFKDGIFISIKCLINKDLSHVYFVSIILVYTF